jgi:hypothetical protein
VEFRFVSTRRRRQYLLSLDEVWSCRLAYDTAAISFDFADLKSRRIAVTLFSCLHMSLRRIFLQCAGLCNHGAQPCGVCFFPRWMHSRRLGNTSRTSHLNSCRRLSRMMRSICIPRGSITLPLRRVESPRPDAQHRSRSEGRGLAMFVGLRPLKQLPRVRRRKRTRSGVLPVIGGSRW